MINQPISPEFHQKLSGRALWWLQKCQPPSLGKGHLCTSCSRLCRHEWQSPAAAPRAGVQRCRPQAQPTRSASGTQLACHRSESHRLCVKWLPGNENVQTQLPALPQTAVDSRNRLTCPMKLQALWIKGHVTQALKDHMCLGQ